MSVHQQTPMTEPTITADEQVELVDLDAMHDAMAFYIEDDETDDPLFVFDVNGTEWLTEHLWVTEWLTEPLWVLPRRLVRGQLPADEMTPANGVSETSAKVVRDLVERLGSVSLGEPSARFAPALAGPLTAAGLTARPVLGGSDDQAHVLVDAQGQNVGWMMPMHPHAKGAVSIPVPAEVVELQARIAALEVVRVSESWKLAAALAHEEVSRNARAHRR